MALLQIVVEIICLFGMHIKFLIFVNHLYLQDYRDQK